ncbi:glycosyltransferase family 4 protein [Egicoccus halophilus]|uniref:GDP-mannose-dependent alpha-(1-2)-phosphatidylinositol mannosyltransferase n=1 Tax=Egicoccus halophilus TaxID=1670830 RepID=A0A8J3A995_9ACTN|nr:glycosyltransferase family 4 protein [Egicoccus halophilus]GGI07291.1 GDP-mannose-dependent alpha-(1-2)-phosphatidylinositol mannosyltransferase [Egicoccus halophilus]
MSGPDVTGPSSSPPLRIALVSPYDLQVPGGVQSHVAQLAAALRAGGDTVHVLGPGSDQAPSLGRALRVPFNGSVAPIVPSPRSLGRLRAQLVDARPDVVHVHEPVVPWAGTAAVRAAVAPVVGTFHAWSDRTRAYRSVRPHARRVLDRLAAAVAVSDAAAGYHAEALGVPVGRFRVVPNGVDVARFADAEPLPQVVDPERPTLLFVGRLEPRKGLEPLIRAFTLLKTRRPELRLHVVGDGPERDRCQQLLPARLRADVVFLGRVSAEELPRFFASCDLYVSPALGGESFGIVLLEAMAAGRPLVASDLPGYRSVARDGVQGRLVTPGAPRELAEAIAALLDNPNLRAAMGAEGRRTVAAYDWPVVASRLRAIYSAVQSR